MSVRCLAPRRTWANAWLTRLMASAGGYPAEVSSESKPEDAKAKKPRPLPPPPPPAVATAALLIQGAAARVLGLRLLSCDELQPIWVTEPGCSKLTLNLESSVRTPFPKEDLHAALIEAIEEETRHLASTSASISVLDVDKADTVVKYGEKSPFASASLEKLHLAYVPGVTFVAIPQNWSVCPSSCSCGSIRFLLKDVEEGSKKKPDTMILAKKKQLMIKFEVEHKDAPAGEVGGDLPDKDIVQELSSGTVRVSVPSVDDPKASASVEVSKVSETGVDAQEKPPGDMVVDPWTVTGRIDYDKLIRDFGSSPISEKLLERIEKLTVGKGRVPALHRWLRRGIFFSHRELDAVCALAEKGTPFYLYTGRGPNSAAMHLGHLLPFMFTKWLQDAFDVPLVIQMTDDEKFLWKGEYDPDTGDNLDHFRKLTVENAKDIIACGFDKKKTFIFSDCDYVGHMYPNIVRTWKAITYNTAKGAFGFAGESNIGQSAFPAIQAVPSFPSSFQVPLRGNHLMPCLIPCAIDQDPYFRVTRDIAHKLVPKEHPLKGKPSLIHCKFFPPLQGAEGKMSSSNENSAVFLTDTPEQIEKKIKEYAFSGGRQTAKEQRERGADLDVDVPFQWLRFFLEDDQELQKIQTEYGSGTGQYWSTGEVKTRLIKLLQIMVAEHKERRAKITDEEVKEWMKVRELEF